MSQLTSVAAPARVAGSWHARLVVVALAVVLFLLGQYNEQVFAALTRAWQALGPLVGHPGWATAQTGVSTHSLPVAMSYRLLYSAVSVLALHVLLRGRGTRLVVASYGVGLAGGMVLLLIGQRLAVPLLTQQGHRLIDLICSPLAPLLVCALVTLGRPSRPQG